MKVFNTICKIVISIGLKLSKWIKYFEIGILKILKFLIE